MSNQFDEDRAVEFIRAELPEEIRNTYSDDEILYVVDCIWDYYEKKGLLSFDNIDADEELLDTSDLVSFVKKEINKIEEVEIEPKHIEPIVKAEIKYEESLDDIF